MNKGGGVGYIKENLLTNEKIIFQTQPHRIIFLLPILLFIGSLFVPYFLKNNLNFLSQTVFMNMTLPTLLGLLIGLIAIFSLIDSMIMYKKSEYGITTKRIVMKTGWIRRRSIEIFLEKVEAIYVDQSVLGRMLDYGIITVVGTGGSRDPFLYVPSPLNFRHQAQQQIDKIDQQYQK